MTRERKGVVVVVFFLFMFLLAGIIFVTYFYFQYQKNVSYLSHQWQLSEKRLSKMQKSIDKITQDLNKINTTVLTLNKRLGDYIDKLAILESEFNLRTTEAEKLSFQIKKIKEDMDNWRKVYSDTLSEVIEKLLSLKEQLKEVEGNKPSKEINLGEIAIER